MNMIPVTPCIPSPSRPSARYGRWGCRAPSPADSEPRGASSLSAQHRPGSSCGLRAYSEGCSRLTRPRNQARQHGPSEPPRPSPYPSSFSVKSVSVSYLNDHDLLTAHDKLHTIVASPYAPLSRQLPPQGSRSADIRPPPEPDDDLSNARLYNIRKPRGFVCGLPCHNDPHTVSLQSHDS